MTRKPKERYESFKLFINVTNAAFDGQLLHLETARILNGIGAGRTRQGAWHSHRLQRQHGCAFRFGHDKP